MLICCKCFFLLVQTSKIFTLFFRESCVCTSRARGQRLVFVHLKILSTVATNVCALTDCFACFVHDGLLNRIYILIALPSILCFSFLNLVKKRRENFSSFYFSQVVLWKSSKLFQLPSACHSICIRPSDQQT